MPLSCSGNFFYPIIFPGNILNILKIIIFTIYTRDNLLYNTLIGKKILRGGNLERLEKLSENYGWIEKIGSKTVIELLKTKDMLEELHDRFFSLYNFSNTKFNVLVILYKGTGEEMYMSKIGERMLLSSANITGLVDRLEEEAYVKRVRSLEDRRKIVVEITEKGIECIERIMADYIIWSENLMGVMSLEENNQLIHLLKVLQEGIIQQEKDNTLNIGGKKL